MDTPQAPQPPAAPDLSFNAYWHLVHTLRGLLPPPPQDTLEALRCRDHAAIVRIAAMVPANADEASLGAHAVAADAHAFDCMRLARANEQHMKQFRQLTAQAASMMREAKAYRGLLLRVQAARVKREATPAGCGRAEWTEHCALGRMTEALDASAPALAPDPVPEGGTPARWEAARDAAATAGWANATPAALPPPATIAAGLKPGAAGLNPVGPETARPGASGLHPAGSDTAGPGASGPDTTGADIAGPGASGLHPVEPDTAGAGAASSDTPSSTQARLAAVARAAQTTDAVRPARPAGGSDRTMLARRPARYVPPPEHAPPMPAPDGRDPSAPIYDLVAEAEMYAAVYPRRAWLIRRLGGLPANCTFGPPPEDLLAAIVTGTSPALLALDAQPNPVP